MSKNSGLLDQILLEDIARHCPNEFLGFHKCMSDPKALCEEEQKNLSNCIKYKVPAFQRIQGICAGKLQNYEACLKINGSNLKKCEKDLEELRDCAFGSLSK